MTPVELAFRIGKSTTALWRYENGKAHPPMKTALRIAEVLDCSLDDLFPSAREAA